MMHMYIYTIPLHPPYLAPLVNISFSFPTRIHLRTPPTPLILHPNRRIRRLRMGPLRTLHTTRRIAFFSRTSTRILGFGTAGGESDFGCTFNGHNGSYDRNIRTKVGGRG